MRSNSLKLRSISSRFSCDSYEELCNLKSASTKNTDLYLLFDLSSKTCRSLELNEMFSYSAVFSRRPFLLYLNVSLKTTIEKLFTAYRLNPLLQAECSEWSFKEKDYVMNVSDCTFIAISDIHIHEDLENPIQIKLLVYSSYIIVVSFEQVYFIRDVFKNNSNIKDFPQLSQDDFFSLITGNKSNMPINIRSAKSSQENADTESCLYSIFDSIISRYEKILFYLLIESKTCMEYMTEIPYKERVEYLVRVSVSEKLLIYFLQLVRPKLALVKKLKGFGRKEHAMGYECLYQRINKMIELGNLGIKLLKNTKVLHRTCCDDKRATESFESGSIAKFYSGFTALCLFPTLMTALWGTNVVLPIGNENDEETFIIMSVLNVVYFLIAGVYLRRKGWI